MIGEKMTKLYFIGGASGSGKTAIKETLSKLLVDSFDVFEMADFEEVSIPEDAVKE